MRRTFDAFEAPEYSREGAESFYAFLEKIPASFAMGLLPIWACYLADTLAGVIALRDGSHICLLFVEERFHRRGIARKLTQQAARFAAERGCAFLTVNSSPYAVPAYQALGFQALSEERVEDGIRYTPMRLEI